MSEPVILLVDNGSRRAAATLNLRRIASALGDAAGRTVHAVSLQHADRIPADALGGRPAEVFPAFLRDQVDAGRRRFVVLPLFFGPSKALTSFIPQQVGPIEAEVGALELRIADVLCPLPGGEPLLADILADQVGETHARPDRVILVDHGSPIPEVTAVREWLAGALRERLAEGVVLDQAVMERREGRDYDFNGRLLEEQLAGTTGETVLSMLFLSPGRHAGEGGDIAEICEAAEQANPGLRVTPSALVGEHPMIVTLLRQRLDAAMDTS
jgi:sirohydrochlorin ferrochelatase